MPCPVSMSEISRRAPSPSWNAQSTAPAAAAAAAANSNRWFWVKFKPLVTDFEDIVEWGEHHLDFLRQFSEFHHGIPCARWLRDLVNRIDPSLFAR
jgi:DDE_Tnp_1-associated